MSVFLQDWLLSANAVFTQGQSVRLSEWLGVRVYLMRQVFPCLEYQGPAPFLQKSLEPHIFF